MHTGQLSGMKDAAKWASHRYWVPLQHQLLGSPHLLLLHLPADRLFGLVGQLTARRQAWIPDHLFNPAEKQQRHKVSCKKRTTKPSVPVTSEHRGGWQNTKEAEASGFFGAAVRVL